jgi:hypothetical protein
MCREAANGPSALGVNEGGVASDPTPRVSRELLSKSMTVMELQALLCASRGAPVDNAGSPWVAGEGIPRVFCKKVRKPLIAKALLERSFLKSAEGFENEEFSFGPCCERTMRKEYVVCGISLEGLKGDFNAVGAESTEKGSWSGNRRDWERNPSWLRVNMGYGSRGRTVLSRR